MYLNNTTQRIFEFPFQHRAGEGAKNVALKTYIACHVSSVSYRSCTPTSQ
jgi:hypothetical protein